MSHGRVQVEEVLSEMRVRKLPERRRQCIERLSRSTWSNDLSALAELWKSCPDLAERYLDIMISEMHEFPSQGYEGRGL